MRHGASTKYDLKARVHMPAMATIEKCYSILIADQGLSHAV